MTENKDLTTVIQSQQGAETYWHALWQYRELFYYLAWRDVIVRYKETIIGIVWALLRPFLTMIVFVVVFNYFARLPSLDGVPYTLMVLTGLLAWQCFASAVSISSESLIANANMISKVYFPRLIIPLSSIVPSFMDAVITLLLLLALCVFYRFMPGWQIIVLPVFIIMLVLLSASIGIFLSALNVIYRDFRYVIPFLLQVGLYVSPIGFASTIVPQKWQIVYALNPVVGIIDGFRWSLLAGAQAFNWPGFILSWVWIIISAVVGVKYFRHVERYFADRI
ncbi:MAG TPA: ABC transporter permease [Alphaproteobacteria bacterium]